MKHKHYIIAIIGLLIAGCTDKNDDVPPITQPVGTGTYQPLTSRLFYMPAYIRSFPIGDWLAWYTTEKSFEQYYNSHPDAERVDPNKNSIILACARQTRRDWDLFGQSFYKVGDKRYILVAHVYPSNQSVWTTSALVPTLPPDAEIGLLEMMHPQKSEPASSAGTYQLYNVKQYPVPGEIKDHFRIIRRIIRMQKPFQFKFLPFRKELQ